MNKYEKALQRICTLALAEQNNQNSKGHAYSFDGEAYVLGKLNEDFELIREVLKEKEN